jgi:hypothetical protein
MRDAVRALCAAPGSIHSRLQAAETHFKLVDNHAEPGSTKWHLFHRIGSGLVEGGDIDCTVADSIAALSETRAAEIAHDMLALFECLVSHAEPNA